MKGFITAAVLALAISPAAAGAQTVPVADLAIMSVTANVAQAKVGQAVTFTIVASNHGPDAAEMDVFPRTFGGFEMTSATCDRGISSDGPFCEYGTLATGDSVTTVMVAQVV